jgi:hypothetical protein
MLQTSWEEFTVKKRLNFFFMKTMLIAKKIKQLLVLIAFFVTRITLFFLSLFPIKFEINFFEHSGFFNRTDLQGFFRRLIFTVGGSFDDWVPLFAQVATCCIMAKAVVVWVNALEREAGFGEDEKEKSEEGAKEKSEEGAKEKSEEGAKEKSEEGAKEKLSEEVRDGSAAQGGADGVV